MTTTLEHLATTYQHVDSLRMIRVTNTLPLVPANKAVPSFPVYYTFDPTIKVGDLVLLEGQTTNEAKPFYHTAYVAEVHGKEAFRVINTGSVQHGMMVTACVARVTLNENRLQRSVMKEIEQIKSMAHENMAAADTMQVVMNAPLPPIQYKVLERGFKYLNEKYKRALIHSKLTAYLNAALLDNPDITVDNVSFSLTREQ